MTSLPTGSTGRTLALSVACVAIGIAYFLVASPLFDLYSERAMRLETRRMLMLKLEAIAGELPELRARVAELTVAASQTSTFEGTSDAIASAGVQARIEKLAATADVMIRSIGTLPTDARGPYRRFGLRITVGGQYESLLELLAEIEKSQPPLVVDHLQIRSVLERPGFRSTSALDASFDIYGFRI